MLIGVRRAVHRAGERDAAAAGENVPAPGPVVRPIFSCLFVWDRRDHVGLDTTKSPSPYNQHSTKHRDASKLPRENLEALLELRFPPPPPPAAAGPQVKQAGEGEGEAEGVATAAAGARGECAVCYAYRLRPAEGGAAAAATDDDASTTPTVACDNPQCGRIYHPRCLRGWLATLPGATQGGGGGGGGGGRAAFMGMGVGVSVGVTMVGSCPYCTQPIALDVPPPSLGGVGGE